MKGEFKRRIETFYFDIGKDKKSNKIASQRIANVFACLVDEAKKEFPIKTDYSHEHFDKLEPEMIIDGFFDAHTFICDVLAWFEKYFGDGGGEKE